MEEILETFKCQVINLMDDIICVCPEDIDLLYIRTFIQIKADSKTLIEGFVKWVLPWKQVIEERNEIFFKDNMHIFGSLPEDKVIKFKNLYFGGTFTAQDKKIIWDYFNVFIKLVERYLNYIKKLN